MPNYKSPDNKVHFIDSADFAHLLPAGSIQITDEDAESITSPTPDPIVVEARRVAALWQAAHDYEYAAISGSAVGLLAMGVLQGKTKALAVQGWIHGIWAEYYIRKAGTSTDTDYTVCGPCPHTVPELIAELPSLVWPA